MKKLIIFFAIFSSVAAHSQNNSDAIIGRWLKIPKEDMIIEVYRSADTYMGKISWTKKANAKKPVGFVILDNLYFNKKNAEWEDGKIHVPDSGKSYDAAAKIGEDGTLELLAYAGMKFLGVKKYFKKID